MDKTQAWTEYEYGTMYQSSIELHQTVRENLNFFYDRQWEDCKAPGMPMPTMNIIKPSIKLKVVQILDPVITMKFMTDGEAPDVTAFLNALTDYSRRTWRRVRMDKKNSLGLTDAANTGDYILYHWWNTRIETGQPFKGDMDNQRIDNVNYLPGNPNDPSVQEQPYIILVMRKMVKTVQDMAKANGRPKQEIESIVADDEYDYQAGDFGKIELDNAKKCTMLLKMWKEDGEKPEVWFAMYTRNAEVQPPKKANLKLYPVSKMAWEEITNCAYGKAETTGLKDNQIFINKQMGFIQAYVMQTAFPPVIYNKTFIPDGWSNKVIKAIGVQGGDVSNVAHYMVPPQLPSDVWVAVDKVKAMTMELIGANDVATGNMASPDNRSAYLAAYNAATLPISMHRTLFFDMMKETGMIWLDMFLSHYPEDRMITIEDQDRNPVQIPFDKKPYENLVYDCDIEVGASQNWSQINELARLDQLLQQGAMTFSQYLEQVPPGIFPDKDKLHEQALIMEQAQQQAQAAQQAAQMGGMA